LYFTYFWDVLNGIRYGTSPLRSFVVLENRLEKGPAFSMGVDGITFTLVPCKRVSLLKETVQCLFNLYTPN
jgi:hypothetical protein